MRRRSVRSESSIATAQGFPKDPGRAYMYLELAAELGEKPAERERDDVARDLPAPLQQSAKHRVSEWLQARNM